MYTLPTDLKEQILMNTSADTLSSLCAMDSSYRAVCTPDVFARRAGVSLKEFNRGRDTSIICPISLAERTKELLSDKESFIGSDDYAMMSICYANALIVEDFRVIIYLTDRDINPINIVEARFDVAVRTDNVMLVKGLDIDSMRNWYVAYILGWACKLRRVEIVKHVFSTNHVNSQLVWRALLQHGNTKLITEIVKENRERIKPYYIDDIINRVYVYSAPGEVIEYDKVLELLFTQGRLDREYIYIIERLVYTDDDRLFDALDILDEYVVTAANFALNHDKIDTLNDIYDKYPKIIVKTGNAYVHPDTIRIVYIRTVSDEQREEIIVSCLNDSCVALARELLSEHPVEKLENIYVTQLSVIEFILLCIKNVDITISRYSYLVQLIKRLVEMDVLLIGQHYSLRVNPYRPDLSNRKVSDYLKSYRRLLIGLGMSD